MATNIPAPPQPDAPSILENVPVPLRVAGAWSWRLIVVGVVAIALATVLATLSTIVVPIAIALLIAAPLESAVTWLERHKIPRAAGAAMILVTLVLDRRRAACRGWPIHHRRP